MSAKITCPRCGQPATVTYSRRGTERIHTHKRADGNRCRPGVYEVPRENDELLQALERNRKPPGEPE